MTRSIGLRETKRRAAMKHVQKVALQLFDAHGFDHVTIEQIAAAADVSESSIYRYFSTKERIVFVDPDFSEDDFAVAGGELLANGFTTREVILQVQRHLTDGLIARAEDPLVQWRMRHLSEVPHLRSAMVVDIHRRTRALVAQIVVEQVPEEDAYDLEVAFSATYGAVLGALEHWRSTGFIEPLPDLLKRTIERVNTGIVPHT